MTRKAKETKGKSITLASGSSTSNSKSKAGTKVSAATVRKAKETKRRSVTSASGSRTSNSKSKPNTKVSAAEGDSFQIAQQENLIASVPLFHEKVAQLAYSYWEKRGRQGGSPEEDWFCAEKEILTQINNRDT
jgi:hypothetical protein